jgi:uncharacterized protein
MESFSDRLKSLGIKTGANQPQTEAKTEEQKTRYDISAVVAGRDLETAFGTTYVVEIDYPLEGLHASGQIAYTVDRRTLGQWARIPNLHERPVNEFLYLDTETSGLAGGTGTFAFLIGLGYWTELGFHLIQLFMRDPGDEPALLAGLTHFLEPFKAIVTFNGKSFDVPLLNTRHVMNGFTTPFTAMPHIDLLPLARRLWRNRLPSRALKDLEIQILGLTRESEDVPGWLIPELYYEYLRSGDARPLGRVLYHNAQDVLSLGLLFNHVSDLLAHPLQVSPEQGLDLIAIARLYEEMDQSEMAVALYEHSLAQGLPLPFFLDTLRRYANLYRKQARWDEAMQLWEKAAGYHQVDACIELAKHIEHRQRDYEAALKWVETALTYVVEIPASPLRFDLQKDLDHRAERIRQKLQAQIKGQE